ncbi:MAG: UDP-N-acetylmuramoyl-L-alanine--D-glutamate ligase, partial [Planctomycetota bacterium]|nr:UDP-N-acetylmuramoyl-L-alanine--D-glutamate ligase [Planctomycetota bacterium]
MGLGLFGGGAGVAAFLARHGALVTVTDLRPASQLAESIQALSSSTLTLHLGGHDLSDFTDTDIVVVNPAVPLDSPFLESARKAGVRLESEINVFFSLCPSRVVGVTGSNGKTTTTVLIGEMLKAAGRKVWVGGNLGKSLLDCVENIRRDDVVVLELSSFQLDMLDWVRTSPYTGVATNICPNHLDRHGSMGAYVSAKRKLFAFQQPDDLAILNFDDKEVSGWRKDIASRVSFFSRKERVPDGAFAADGRLCLGSKGKSTDVCAASDALIPGWFNTENILAAMCAAAEHGAKPAHIAQIVREFKGVEHRL